MKVQFSRVERTVLADQDKLAARRLIAPRAGEVQTGALAHKVEDSHLVRVLMQPDHAFGAVDGEREGIQRVFQAIKDEWLAGSKVPRAVDEAVIVVMMIVIVRVISGWNC